MKKPYIQPHKNIPEGCFEEEQGQKGFYGPVSHLIRKRASTRWTHIEGSLKPRMFDLNPLKANLWEKLLYSDSLNIHFYSANKSSEGAFRNADGDLLFFCHKGEGAILTEYGLLDYRPGCYILIPKCFTHAVAPQSATRFLVIESLRGHFREPHRGLLGQNALYSKEALTKPSLPALRDFLKQSQREFKKVTVYHQTESTDFHYKDCVFDVVEWRGDLFPFRLSMDDILPIMSHRVHLPPSAHTSFVADDFIVCSFLPRPLESDRDALKVPFYHQNTDYDEVIFYHKGDFFSRDGLEPGMMSLHPAGFPHGPHPKAVQAIKGKSRTNEYAVMIDSLKALKRTKALGPLEQSSYWKSWSE